MEDWEAQLAESDSTEYDKAIEEYESKLESKKQSRPARDVIVDQEVGGVGWMEEWMVEGKREGRNRWIGEGLDGWVLDGQMDG